MYEKYLKSAVKKKHNKNPKVFHMLTQILVHAEISNYDQKKTQNTSPPKKPSWVLLVFIRSPFSR